MAAHILTLRIATRDEINQTVTIAVREHASKFDANIRLQDVTNAQAPDSQMGIGGLTD